MSVRWFHTAARVAGWGGAITVASGILVTVAVATPTGLNNIPTADTPPDRTVVIQAFANLREGSQDDFVAGFKMGLRPWEQRLEWGVDGRLGEGGTGPAVFQGKYAIQPWEELPAVAVGVANLAVTSEDRDEVGQAAKYLVGTHDFNWFRGHVGFSFQQDNDAAFFGFDKTVDVLGRDLMLRTDFTQIDDADQWLGSGGFIYFLHENFAVESWVSVPFEHGKPTFTLKLNFIFDF